MKFRIFLFSVSTAFSGFLQAQFQLLAVTSGNTCTWKIKNTDTVAHKLTSISIRFFHHKPDMIFTPAISMPGGGRYQFKGNFNGSAGYNFAYKTIQIVGLDTLLPSGGDAVASITSNEGLVKDTILAAGVKVYYSDNSVPKTADVFPAGVSPCPTEAVFINAGSSNSGIKLGSAAAQNLHSGVCENHLIAIVFDNHTLLRKPVTGVTPHCPNGRKWTTYGNSTDFQIYYTFDITAQQGRKQFDSLVNAMSTGDYIAITNNPMVSLQTYDSITQTLDKIGYKNPVLGDTIGYVSIIGKKGATPGEAAWNYCKDPHGTCYISLEQSLTQDDMSASIKDFSSCYESMQQVLDKAQPQGAGNLGAGRFTIYPNPTSNNWNVSGVNGSFQYFITDASGKIVMQKKECINNQIEGTNLNPGIYFIHIEQSFNKSYVSVIMKTH